MSVVSGFMIFLVGLCGATRLAARLGLSVRIGVGLYLWHTAFCMIYAWYVVSFGGDAIYYYERAAAGGNEFALGTPMVDLLAELIIAVTGTSFLGVSLAFNLPGSIGLLLLHDALRRTIEQSGDLPRRLVMPITLLPSASFWSSGIGKDGIAFMAVALMTWASLRTSTGRPAMVVAVAMMMMVRPHIAGLMLIALLIGALGLPERSGVHRLASAVAIGAVVIGLLPLILRFLGLGHAEGLNDVSNYVEQRQLYNRAGEAGIDIAQLPLPLQITTYLFRPLPHEAWSIFALVASIEVLVLLGLGALAIHARSLGGVGALHGRSLVLWVHVTGGALHACHHDGQHGDCPETEMDADASAASAAHRDNLSKKKKRKRSAVGVGTEPRRTPPTAGRHHSSKPADRSRTNALGSCMALLVGFVNKFYSPELSIGLLDMNSERFAWPSSSDLKDACTGAKGVNGICRYRDHWLIGLQSSPTRLLVLDDQLGLRSTIHLPDVVDLHSIVPYEGGLLTVSTGTDTVFKIELSESLDLIAITPWWSATNDPVDSHHVNSVGVSAGRVLLTMFGPKQPGGWAATRSGRLFAPLAGETLHAPLHHPHTVLDVDGAWVVCESGTGKVHFADGRILDVGGYVRGLAIDHDSLYVGTSGRRLRSRGEGTLNLSEDTVETTSAVHRFDRHTLGHQSTIALDLFGTEIFELATTDDTVLQAAAEADPREVQIRSLQQQVYAMSAQTTSSSLLRRLRHLGFRRPLGPARDRLPPGR